MVWRVGEPVAVRTDHGRGAPAEEDVPATFLWRGRVYVVREVLGHWQERTAWWTAAAARAVRGEDEPGGGEGGGTGGSAAPGGPAAGVSEGSALGEREVWRVEASPGRTFGSGVYDLSRDAAGSGRGVPAPAGEWLLLRVTD